jgi:gas vesicle protein
MRNGYAGYLGCFFAGALVGCTVATFLTPYDGRRMRRMARRKIEDGVEEVSQVVTNLNETCHELYDRSGKLVHDASKKFAALV